MQARIERLLASPASAPALLLALTTLAYLGSFAGVPQFDDYAVILDEPRVATLAAWWNSMPGIRPLLKLSYALNNEVDGVFGFHLVNLALHLGNVVLAWRLLLRLLPQGGEFAAFLAALLFALHPVNGEAVTLLNGRSVALAALGVQGSLLALLAGRVRLSLALFVVAVLVRETALVVPALGCLCIAWIGWRDRAPHAFAGALRATRWHWLLALGAVLLLLAVPRYRELLAFSIALRGPLDNLVTQAGATLWLLEQLLRPFASNSDPRLPVFVQWDAWWIGACLLWTLVLALSIARVRNGSWLAFSVLWFALALVPTNALIARIDVANERQLYLAAIPLFALVALAAQRNLGSGLIFGTKIGPDLTFRGRRSTPPIAQAISVLLVLVLLFATILRNRDYQSETTFWRAVLQRDATNPRAWNNLGFALEHERNDAAGALRAYDHAIALDPDDYKPHFNRRALCARLPRQPGCAP